MILSYSIKARCAENVCEKEAMRSLTIRRLQRFMNEISCRLEINIQIKVCRVICWNATIHKVVAIKALVPYAASLGVSSI